ncbi:beta-fructofuranosidase, insoluble isoenzyme CWINV6 [Selaginella moellendorffii]|uniref:beta-fructofuranosidase, insoluble isoenzyme CWINV6 n=1 Tax=Selaginella moellendorffii TaxID=88036 RepID=UPI000D1C3542|nr:beta-fructofuranosidase, insoluble isoenzyme CWINV6 [Selaginella moellendorffii]|eukprot:XP_024532024.1 beta-fructofuranosidase, insoluble isoenzyme CWINV6 [Selaginella moellendorffii]
MAEEEEDHAFLASTAPRILRAFDVQQRGGDEDRPLPRPLPRPRLLWVSLLVLLAAISAGGIALLFRAPGIGFHTAGSARDGAAMALGFHFQAPPNSSIWMISPNAPVFYRGFYHLFYRFTTPSSSSSKNQSSWGHAIAKDLLHWTHLPTALDPGPERYDEQGILGGSMTLLVQGPVILYTGISSDGATTQNAAVPVDPGDAMLKHWKKIAQNPLIPAGGRVAMRDPSSAWRDSSWRILLGGENASDGVGFVYWSNDFLDGEWKRLETPLLRMPGAGILESPDFFQVSESKHVVKASLRDDPAATFGSDSYAVGRYFSENGSFVPDDDPGAGRTLGLRYDHGNSFFASKSFADTAKDRRVLWALLPKDPLSKVARAPPVQSIPRKLWLGSDEDEEELLLQLPVDELASLRIGPGIHMADVTLEPGAVIQVGGDALPQLDAELVFELPDLTTQMSMENFDVEFSSTGNAAAHCRKKGARVNGILGPFGLLVLATGDLAEHTAIFFHLGRSRKGPVALVCADHSRSSLANHPEEDLSAAALHGAFVHLDDPTVFRKVAKAEVEVLELRVLVDNSVVETFGQGGKISITSRVHPTLAKGDAARLFLFNNGTNAVRLKRLDAWKMKAAEATLL